MKRMIARGVVKEDQRVSIYKAPWFPPTGCRHVYKLKPELAAKVREPVMSFPWEGSALNAQFGPSCEVKFIPITYKGHWSVVGRIDAANKVEHACR